MIHASILIVQGGDAETRPLAECLQGFGYAVCATVATAREALDKAPDLTPDLALVDLDPDGAAGAERIGNELDIPVVRLTDGKAPDPGPAAHPCVLKPFDERQLHWNIQTALGMRERENGHREARGELERRVAELQTQVETMEFIFDSMEEGVIAADTQGTRLLFNAGAERLGGAVEPNDKFEEWAALLGVYCLDKETLLPVEQNPLVLALHGQRTDGVELFVRNGQQPQGAYVNVNGRPLRDRAGELRGGVVVFWDITDEKETKSRLSRTLSELRERTELLETILDSIHDGIIVSDESGEFLYVNPGAKEILDEAYIARRQGKWSEKASEVYFYPDRETPIRNEDLPLARAIFNGETIDDMHIFVRRSSHPSGGIFLWTSARPLLNELGGIRGGVIIFRDVTQRVLAEEALTQAFAQGRLEVVDTILHNIGNAINSVTAGIDTLHLHLDNDPLVRRLCAMADAVRLHADDWIDYLRNDSQGRKVMPFILSLADDFAARRTSLARTVERVRDRANHIADIVRIQKAPNGSHVALKDIDIGQALSEAVRVAQESFDTRDIAIEVDCADSPKEIRTRESAFLQMIVNFIKNSAQAIREIEASDGLPETPRIRIRARVEGNFLNLEVSDNGIGFDSKDTRAFFAAGYTTKESGTGLGLHSAANFVLGSGGQIDLSSDGVGTGATVRVKLRLPPPPLIRPV